MMKSKMKPRMKKAMALFTMVCILGVLTAGCSSDSESAAETEAENTQDSVPAPAPEAERPEDSEDVQGEPEEGNSGGKWQVLDPETAAAVDADFEGEVCRMEKDSFFIVKSESMLLDDGALLASSPSSAVDVPESDQIQVVFDEDTRFYIRTIYENGERYEDSEAGFQDLEKKDSVEMKGYFENDIFHADEVRIPRIA